MITFPYRRINLLNKYKLWVKYYPLRQPYDVVGTPDSKYSLTDFVPVKYPGCGFFARTTNSHSYMRMVQQNRMAFAKTFKNLVSPQQLPLHKLIELVKRAMQNNNDPMYERLYDTYLSQLILSDEEDQLCRSIEYLRRMMHKVDHHRFSADRKDCAHALRQIDKRRKIATFDICQFYSPEKIEAYGRMVDAFWAMSRVHHIWDMRFQNDSNENSRVFFDLGALFFVFQPYPIPMMRDARGRLFALLPDRVLLFRAPFDFDTFMLDTLDIRYGSLNDGVQSELMIAQLDLLYRFTSVRRVSNFVQAWKELQKQ